MYRMYRMYQSNPH